MNLIETGALQARCTDWARVCFPDDPIIRPKVRAIRFLEEAIELVQTMDISREKAHELVDYVFNRPVGYPAQELGGTMLTLMLVAEALDLDAGGEAEAELVSAYERIPQIREKSKNKVKAN